MQQRPRKRMQKSELAARCERGQAVDQTLRSLLQFVLNLQRANGLCCRPGLRARARTQLIAPASQEESNKVCTTNRACPTRTKPPATLLLPPPLLLLRQHGHPRRQAPRLRSRKPASLTTPDSGRSGATTSEWACPHRNTSMWRRSPLLSPLLPTAMAVAPYLAPYSRSGPLPRLLSPNLQLPLRLLRRQPPPP